MKLPVFDGVQEALEKHNLQRKRKLEREKTTPVKKMRIELKKSRVVEGFRRSEWSRKHGNDEHESDHAKVLKTQKGQG